MLPREENLAQWFSTGVPRVAVRGSTETDRICLERNSQPQFYAIAATSALGSLHRVPWTKKTFAEGSAAAKRLKNTDLGDNSSFGENNVAKGE